jgi:hypothetical protein
LDGLHVLETSTIDGDFLVVLLQDAILAGRFAKRGADILAAFSGFVLCSASSSSSGVSKGKGKGRGKGERGPCFKKLRGGVCTTPGCPHFHGPWSEAERTELLKKYSRVIKPATGEKAAEVKQEKEE